MLKFVSLLIIVGAAAFAQDRGTIRGTVSDPSGAPAPESTVTARNVNTGLTLSVKTGEDGVYNLPYLPAGDYTVTTEKAGFRKAEITGVKVNVATVTDVDVQMTI